jgi:hypothetical protein
MMVAMNKVGLAILAGVLLALSVAAEQKTSELNFVVLKEDNGKPVRNASIVLHPVSKEGRQSSGGVQLKTDPDGKAGFSAAPYGKLRVQVLMRGFQTYGEDFEINQPQQEIVIKLKRPREQYSIYGTPEPKKPDDKPPKQ